MASESQPVSLGVLRRTAATVKKVLGASYSLRLLPPESGDAVPGLLTEPLHDLDGGWKLVACSEAAQVDLGTPPAERELQLLRLLAECDCQRESVVRRLIGAYDAVASVERLAQEFEARVRDDGRLSRTEATELLQTLVALSASAVEGSCGYAMLRGYDTELRAKTGTERLGAAGEQALGALAEQIAAATTGEAVITATGSDRAHSELRRMMRAAKIVFGIRLPLGGLGPARGWLVVLAERSYDLAMSRGIRLARSYATLAAALIALGEHMARAGARAEGRAEFLRFLAHEVRDPLATIRLLADEIGATPDVDAESELIGAIHDQLDWAHELSEALLDLEELGDRTQQPEPRCDFVTATDRAVRLMRRLVEYNACTLSVAASPESLRVVCAEHRVVAPLCMVIDNAGKHAKPCAITVTLANDGGRATAIVSDTGPGMTMAELQSLASQPPLKRLGLYLARRLVEGSGGAMSVQAGVGEGTTVTLQWPIGD